MRRPVHTLMAIDSPNRRFAASAITTIAATLVALGCGKMSASTSTAAADTVASASSAAGQSSPSRPRGRPKRPAPAASAAALPSRTKFSGCHVRGQLPDPACTPGAIFARATVSQICTPGYSRSVRNVPASVKHSVYAEYGIESHLPGSFEVDHLVPLELGGNNSAANLWPEISPGYHEKDGIENRLHRAVCLGSVSLRTAQLQIARDWRHTFVGAPGGGAPR